jgi:hypothetical protein
MQKTQFCQYPNEIAKSWIKQYKAYPYDYPYQGVCCIFIPQNKYEGLKLYEDKIQAERACNLQNIAANYGLAPPVVEGVSTFKNYVDKSHIYGYTTRIAKTHTKFSCDVIYKFWCEFYCKTGYFLDDMHNGNLGKYNGHMVCIDYSHYDTGKSISAGYVEVSHKIYPIRCFSSIYLYEKFGDYKIQHGNITVNTDKCVAEIL